MEKLNKAERILLVKAMEFLARQINDENVFDSWLLAGVADGDIRYMDHGYNELVDDDDYGYYIEDKNFKDLMTVFLRCMARAYKSGGLYCNGIVSDEKKAEHTFGSVCWCEDDVKSAMELREIPLTDENVGKAVTAVENNHYLRDAMIERGWEVIDYILGEEFPET